MSEDQGEFISMMLPRVRYGDEGGTWDGMADTMPCGDCGVVKGEFHHFGCDIERCPYVEGCPCKGDGQLLSCEHLCCVDDSDGLDDSDG